MKTKLHKTIFEETDCLSRDELSKYAQNLLPPSKMHHIEKHLLGCDLCTDALEGFIALPVSANVKSSLDSQLQTMIEKNIEKKSSFRWLIAASFIGILGIGTLIYVFKDSRENKIVQVNELENPVNSQKPDDFKSTIKDKVPLQEPFSSQVDANEETKSDLKPNSNISQNQPIKADEKLTESLNFGYNSQTVSGEQNFPQEITVSDNIQPTEKLADEGLKNNLESNSQLILTESAAAKDRVTTKSAGNSEQLNKQNEIEESKRLESGALAKNQASENSSMKKAEEDYKARSAAEESYRKKAEEESKAKRAADEANRKKADDNAKNKAIAEVEAQKRTKSQSSNERYEKAGSKDYKVEDYSDEYKEDVQYEKMELAKSVPPAYSNETDKQNSEKESSDKTIQISYEEYLKQALTEFDKKNYAGAIEKFIHIKSTYPKDVNADFYLGMSYYYSKNYKKAIEYLGNVQSSDKNTFLEESKWYIAKSYVELSQKLKAMGILKEIAAKEGVYQEPAKLLLGELKD